MKKFSIVAIFAGALALFALPASAVPIHATFNGNVTGSSGFFTTVLSDFPAGTAASFDVTFDDTNLLSYAPLSNYDLAPVSGWVRLGALQWAINAGSVYSYTYSGTAPNPIFAYGLQLTGTGPTIGGAAELFGLFLRLDPALNPTGTNPFSVGFGYPVQGGTFYSYADLGGTHSITRTTGVPEPSGLLLLSAGLLVFGARKTLAKRAI